MSAYVCSDDHINLLASYGVTNKVSFHHKDRRYSFADDPQALAAALYAENVRSVNYRYRESTTADDFQYQPYGVEPGLKVYSLAKGMKEELPPPNLCGVEPVMILKLCDCYDYQACETDDYENSLAWKAVQAVRKDAIHKLPGWDAAPWGI